MKRITALGLTAAIALATAGLSTGCASAASAPTARPLKVMPLGDSITAGSGSATGSSYRAPLWNLVAGQSRYSVDFVGSGNSGALPDTDNEGHSGYLIDQISAGIDGWMAAAQPDVVLLHIGINDMDRSTDKAHASDRLAALLDRINADRPGTTVLVQGLIPTTGGLEALSQDFNAKVKALIPGKQAAGEKVRYVEPPALTGAEFNDRLHPNDAGYSRMGQAFYGALDKAFTDGLATTRTAPRAGTESGTGRVRWADWDGDGKADYLTIADNGAVNVFLNKGGDGHGGWQDLGQVATGTTTDRSRVHLADFDGDGKADYITVNPNGSVTVFLNKGGDDHGGWSLLGQVATGTTTDQNAVTFADFDGDGKADYVTTAGSGAVNVFLNRGGDTGGGWAGLGQIATGVTTDRSRIRWADLDGDGKADYTVINTSGSITPYLNRGGDGHGGWGVPGQFATGVTSDQSAVAFADVNGDARADYLFTTPTGSVNAYTNNGGDVSGAGGWTGGDQFAAGA
ncbi:FG-GAP-like repeat-containing protein [Kitasatospora sp. NPDC002227]|uniref:FG-GAP-like repeat-containing protein n=1 Tax=Kitasatospora sp. NPDC002227 TaxID=3154773 RepID=UPI00331A58A6